MAWSHKPAREAIVEANYPDSDNSYLTEVANELLEEAQTVADEKIENLIARISNQDAA